MIKRYTISILSLIILSIFTLACATLQPERIDDDHIWITASGDSTFGRHMEKKLLKIEEEDGFEAAINYPYERVKEIHSRSDITITNLEGTFSNCEEDEGYPKKFNFKCCPRFAASLNKGNIDIVNVANNHIFDYYAKGAYETLAALKEHGIVYCGGGFNKSDASFKIIEKKGIRAAFLGYGQVFGYRYYLKAMKDPDYPVYMRAYIDEFMVKDIDKALDYADIIVVSIHGGIEKSHYPDEEQIEAARLAIDTGADIVFMHHPHVLQGIEHYKEGIIFYSLGNFAFGGNKYPLDPDSFIAQVKCSRYGVVDFRVIPIRTHSEEMSFQPYVPKDTSSIEKKVIKRSKPFKHKKIEFERFD